MTNDRVYQVAVERLAKLFQEQRELEAFIATYQKLAADAGASEPAPLLPPAVAAMPVVVDNVKATPAMQARSSTEQIVMAAMEIIAANKGPMRLSAICDAVLAKGIAIGGKVPRNNLGAKLSADPRLQTITGRGWWFKGEPLPEDVENDRGGYRFDEMTEGSEAEASEPSHLNAATSVLPGRTETHAD